jgi:hypothetical protein
MHTNFFEYPTVHHGHRPTATERAGMVGALPWRTPESTWWPVRKWSAFGQRILHCLKRGTDIVAQGLEPCSCACLAGFQLSCVH